MIDIKKSIEKHNRAIQDACILPACYVVDDVGKSRHSEKEYIRLLDYWWEKMSDRFEKQITNRFCK